MAADVPSGVSSCPACAPADCTILLRFPASIARAWPPKRISIMEKKLANMIPAERITPNIASNLMEMVGNAAMAYTPRLDWRMSSKAYEA